MEKGKVYLEIKKCSDCAFFKEGWPYSTDGWDRMVDWLCTNPKFKKAKDKEKKVVGYKKIAGGVEWHEENKIEIPDWCPLRKKL